MRLSSRTRVAVRPSLAWAETTSRTRWKDEAGATGGVRTEGGKERGEEGNLREGGKEGGEKW